MTGNRLGWVVALIVLLAAGAAGQRSQKGPKRGPTVKGKLGKQLDRHMLSLDKRAGGFCGSAFVSRGGKVLLAKGYGLADAAKQRKMPHDALWDWASVSKQFTAAAILKLEMQQKLCIDDSIRKHFPQAAENKQPITIRHMLNHTSGIDQSKRPEGVDFRKRDAVVAYFLQLPVARKPGEKWEYSNLTYFVLAALVEKLSGQTFEDYSVKSLFRPAGMKNACFIGYPGLDLDRVPKDDRGNGRHFAYGYDLTWGYKGSGGAIASPHEMMLWDQALRGKKILSAQAKADYYRVGLEDYALGWYVRKWPNDEIGYEHTGRVGNTVTCYLRLKNAKVVVALAYSYGRFGERPDHTAHRLARMVLGAGR